MIEYVAALIIWMIVYYFDVWSRFDNNGKLVFSILMLILIGSDSAIKIIHREEKKGG